MIRRKPLIGIIAAGLLLSLAHNALAQSSPEPALKPLPFVSTIFGDNMVLQRGKKNIIWGWSEPGDKIRVKIAGKTASGVAGPDRRWQVKIQPPAAGGPYTIKIGVNQPGELQKVLLGVFWLWGAQPNRGVTPRFAKNG